MIIVLNDDCSIENKMLKPKVPLKLRLALERQAALRSSGRGNRWKVMKSITG